MSDVVRSYSRPSKSLSAKPSRGLLRGGLRLTRFFLLVVLIAAVYVFWISRDTHDVQEFVPADTAYLITSKDLAQNRARILNSHIWNAFPESLRANPIVHLLDTELDIADWKLRNLLGQRVLIYGQDASTFSDAVYVIQTTMVGALLERNARRGDSIVLDAAGGLDIRFMPDHALYYAKRGRLLIASASRDSLIRTLTLEASERIQEEGSIESLWPTGDEDVRGMVQRSADSETISAVGFAARLESQQGFLKMSVSYSDAFKERYSLNSLGAETPALVRPVDGPVALSSNLSIPVDELMGLLMDNESLNTLMGGDWGVGEASGDAESAEGIVHSILSQIQPGLAITWHGFDTSDIVPTSVYSMIGGYEGDGVAKAIAQSMKQQHAVAYTPISLAFNEERQWLEVNSMGIGAMTSVLYPAGVDSLFYSTSLHQAERNWADGASVEYIEQGHFFIRLHPKAILSAYREFGTSMLSYDLLDGHTVESFESQMNEWESQFSTLEEATLSAMYDRADDVFNINVTLKSAAQ